MMRETGAGVFVFARVERAESAGGGAIAEDGSKQVGQAGRRERCRQRLQE